MAPIALLLIAGSVAALIGSARRQKAPRGSANEDINLFLVSCEFDASLPQDSAQVTRFLMSSLIQGMTTEAEAFKVANDLQDRGYPKTANCIRSLIKKIRAAKGKS